MAPMKLTEVAKTLPADQREQLRDTAMASHSRTAAAAAGPSTGDAEIDALKARVARLEVENEQLRLQKRAGELERENAIMRAGGDDAAAAEEEAVPGFVNLGDGSGWEVVNEPVPPPPPPPPPPAAAAAQPPPPPPTHAAPATKTVFVDENDEEYDYDQERSWKSLRTEGQALFKGGAHAAALAKFGEALAWLCPIIDGDDAVPCEQGGGVAELPEWEVWTRRDAMALLSMRAACHLKLGNWLDARDAAEACETCVTKGDRNKSSSSPSAAEEGKQLVAAWFKPMVQLAEARMRLGQFEKALEACAEAASRVPAGPKHAQSALLVKRTRARVEKAAYGKVVHEPAAKALAKAAPAAAAPADDRAAAAAAVAEAAAAAGGGPSRATPVHGPQPDGGDEPYFYSRVLSPFEAKSMMRAVLMKFDAPKHKAELAAAHRAASAKGGAMEAMMEHVAPVCMRIQAGAICDFEFPKSDDGVRLFGASIQRCLQNNPDRELQEMVMEMRNRSMRGDYDDDGKLKLWSQGADGDGDGGGGEAEAAGEAAPADVEDSAPGRVKFW